MQMRLVTVLIVISGHIRNMSSIPVIGGRMMMLYDIAWSLALIFLGLPALVMPEVVEDARGVTVGM